MGRLDDVLATLQNAVTGAINNANPPPVTNRGQVIIGWPLGPELVEILGQGAGQWQISLYPLKQGKNTTRFRPRRLYTPAAAPTLVATVDDGDITLSGTVDAGLTVHTVIDNLGDAIVQTTEGQTLAQLATAVASAIVALGLPGRNASASGDGLTVTGAHTVICNVVGVAGTSTREVSRIARDVQMSIWASDPDTASALEGAILPVVGIATAPKLTLPDGTLMWVRYGGDLWNDDSQSSYSLYVAHHIFWCEYGVMQVETAYEIGATELIRVTNNNPPVTSYSGGT